jgi:agmatinase
MEICNIKGIQTESPLDLAGKHGAVAINAIYAATRQIFDKGLTPILLGGEHTISIGAIRAAFEKFPDLHVIHVDAHADLRETYEGNAYSHACVMKRVHDLGVPIHSVGVRALSVEESVFIRDKKIHVLFDTQRQQQKEWVPDFLDRVPRNAPIYLSIDVDGLDPAMIPHTGTPVPGGLSWYEILELCRNITQRFNLKGFDVVELSPNEASHASDFLAAKLIYKIISYNEYDQN